jgi:hypothetical protein
MIRRRRMTPKQKKLAKAVVLDPAATLSQLGEQSGYAGRSQVHRALQAPAVVDYLAKARDLMDQREKLSLGSLLTKIEEGLEATELKSVALDDDAKLRPSVEVPDFAVRHKYLETAMELRGIAGKKDEAGQAAGAINLSIILGGGGSELERQGVVDVLVAARISRGLHPLENRKLTPEEADEMRRTT